MKNVIELKEVWKTYWMGDNPVHALRGLTLEIKNGEFVAIQGPSGSGKSTSMNLVGCLDTPSKGTVWLDGKDISKMTESDLATIRGQKIGFIFQKFNLIPTLTALENVTLPMTFQNIPSAKRIETAKRVLTMVGLADRMTHKPNELSGGQQQRVAIARALAVDPPVLLADEPTGNLDSVTGQQIMKFLRELNTKHKKTIVLVTHDDKLAREADRIAVIKDGRIVRQIKT